MSPYGPLHDHGDLREELRALDGVLAHPLCPPPGHALHGLLAKAAHFFAHALVTHMRDEELDFYPSLDGRVRPGTMATLREQHAALEVMAGMFSRQHEAFLAEPDEPRWQALRHIGQRMAAALQAHLDLEDKVLELLT